MRKTGSEELYSRENDPNEWYNLIGEEGYADIIEGMKKTLPSEFAPSATPRRDLNLIVERDSFHWEKKSR